MTAVLIDGAWVLRLIDRLVHHCYIVNMRGNSYRKKHHAEFYAALHPRRLRRSSVRVPISFSGDGICWLKSRHFPSC